MRVDAKQFWALQEDQASREDNLIYDLKNMAAYDISPVHCAEWGLVDSFCQKGDIL